MADIEFFKTDVKEFDAIDDEIKQISEKMKPLTLKLKQLKSKKSELQGNICEYMSKNDIDTCNLKSGSLVYKESRTVKPINQSDVKESINLFFNNGENDEILKKNPMEIADTLINFIYDTNRESSTKISLRRSKGVGN
jgi:hypothetical protein